ncbi:CPBP family intramembrane glutamate endopeptidase [Paenarthrobacter sp. RAF9]
MGTITSKARLYRFTALDALAVAAYLGFTIYFTVAGGTVERLMLQLFRDPATASYAVNALFYAGVGIFAIASAWRVAGRDLRILGTRPWFTLGMVPLAIVVMLILTAILVAALGTAETSENQLGIQGLLQHVPAWLMVPLLVFASIHVIGREGLVLSALAPYLGMAVVLVAVYVWTGKNLMFSYFVHAAKNLMAVVLIYAIPPELLPT